MEELEGHPNSSIYSSTCRSVSMYTGTDLYHNLGFLEVFRMKAKDRRTVFWLSNSATPYKSAQLVFKSGDTHLKVTSNVRTVGYKSHDPCFHKK